VLPGATINSAGMTIPAQSINRVPWWALAAPLAAWLLLAAKFTHFVPADTLAVLIPAAVLLLACVFAAVHHAEVVALRVGEPMGSIVLAIAVTVIEVALIVSMMLAAKDGGGALARDTVFAAVMLVLNGVVGLCLVVGGARHGEQSFQELGASAALSVLGTLAALALVVPNYTRTTPGPFYAPAQLLFVGFVSLLLYAVFLFVQTIRHRDYFTTGDNEHAGFSPSGRVTATSLGLLVAALVAVVLLAKTLSPSLERAMAAVTAALANRLQTSLNLALGSALASIGLTIPAVAVVSMFLGQPLTLGLEPVEMTLLLLTLFISTVTLATGRTTILQGAVHLVILGVFLLLSAIP
jgi:Ca2+:H+ antiporter